MSIGCSTEGSLQIQLLVTRIPKRLRHYYDSINKNVDNARAGVGAGGLDRAPSHRPVRRTGRTFTLRLDKSDASVGIGSMRSNLLKLFASPFNPKQFADFKLSNTNNNNRKGSGSSGGVDGAFNSSRSASTSTHPSSPISSNRSKTALRIQYDQAIAALQPTGNIRMRSLIVDLHPPAFNAAVSCSTASTDVFQMFRPDEVSHVVFAQAIASFKSHSHSLRQNDVEGRDDPKSSVVHAIGGVTFYPGCDPMQLAHEYVAV